MIYLDKHDTSMAKIKVIGVGGCGGNAINNMINQGLTGVSFISANTDKQVLDTNQAQIKLQIGREKTKGLGAGGYPEVGKLSAEESLEEIKEAIKGSEMVFITAGMGGGTGTGAAPIIARAAKELDSLVVAVVTRPFSWEGKRSKVADEGIAELREYVDALITIPNSKLLDVTDKKATFKQAYLKADEILINATRGISDIITKAGLVNVDFADVRSVMKGMGDALMGIGVATGENRAIEATKNALNSPLLDNISIHGSKGVLVNITGSEATTTLYEVAQAVAMIEEAAGPDVNLIHGVVLVDEPMDELMVTVVATGFNSQEQKPKLMRPSVNFRPADSELFKEKTITNNFSDNKFEQNPEHILEKKSTLMNNQVSPKGTDDLKEFDIPAYVRRIGKDANNDNAMADNKAINIPDKIPAGLAPDKTAAIKNYDQPAFLRKIMD